MKKIMLIGLLLIGTMVYAEVVQTYYFWGYMDNKYKSTASQCFDGIKAPLDFLKFCKNQNGHFDFYVDEQNSGRATCQVWAKIYYKYHFYSLESCIEDRAQFAAAAGIK